jgi:hypothetical protein
VDSEKEKRSLDLAAYFGTHPALLGRTANRPRLEDLKAGKFATALNPEAVRIFSRSAFASLKSSVKDRFDGFALYYRYAR